MPFTWTSRRRLTVSHPELLLKLWLAGITGSLWKSFRAYLTNRQQVVSLNGHKSSLLPVISGVPQGSIVGCLLFAIYINNLPFSTCISFILSFADDTKCYTNIRSPSDSLSELTGLNHSDLNLE